MPLDFQCPHCGAQTNVDDRFSGQSGPCAICGKTITIPPFERGTANAPRTGNSGGPIAALVLVVALVMVFLCAGAGLLSFRFAAIPTPAPMPASSQCQNNLKALAIAMHNYHDRYKSFPPAYVADEEGTPMHSWRILLLPFMGRLDLYEQYDFNEPWDGPNNSRLQTMIPTEYRCLDDVLGAVGETSYAMITGPGFLGDADNATRISDIKDGTSNTIMFVEAHGSGITWTEPRDLDGTTMSFLINTDQLGELQGHGTSVTAAFCDAAVHELPATTPPQDMRAMATIAGGEPVAIP